jgi:hypothetical protein
MQSDSYFTPTLTLPHQGGGKKTGHLCKVYLGRNTRGGNEKNRGLALAEETEDMRNRFWTDCKGHD